MASATSLNIFVFAPTLAKKAPNICNMQDALPKNRLLFKVRISVPPLMLRRDDHLPSYARAGMGSMEESGFNTQIQA